MDISAGLILKLAIVTEGVLLAISLVWASFRNPGVSTSLTLEAFINGLIATGPLVAFNFAVFIILARRARYQVYRRFLESAVFPLCKALNWWIAIPVALLAGFGEEIFFRVMLYPELEQIGGSIFAAVLSSYLFAHLHFLGRAKEYLPVLLLYFLFGLYFCYIAHFKYSPAAAIVAHAVYDYVVIIFIKYVEIPFHPLGPDKTALSGDSELSAVVSEE